MTRALRLIAALVATLLFVLARGAAADEVRRAGTVRLEAVGGGHGPIDLAPSNKDSYVGALDIVNDGKEPLVVSRVAVRGDASDPRAPPKLIAHLEEGTLPATIPPGASRRAKVEWSPEHGIKLRQLFAHVVVTTSDEASGEVAMGVRAQLPGPLAQLEGRALSLLIGVPLLGALLTFLARAAGRKDDRIAHVIASGALGLQSALAIYVYRGFVPDVTRLDGNDGLQFIEHTVWIRGISAELFLGVDGTSAAAVLVVSIVAFLGMLPERTVPLGTAGYHAAYLVLAAAVPGALVAQDAALFVLLTAVAVVSASLLVGGWGGAERRRAAARLAVLGTIAVILLLVASISIARHADPTFLVDGTKTSTTFSIPELSRVALGGKGATLFGGALPKVAFGLVLGASLVLLGAFPLHGWVTPVLVEARTASGALVVAAMPALGTSALLRIGCGVLPEGMRWASGVVVALGAVSAAFGALMAAGQSDLRKLAAAATTCQVGFALLGVGSLTPQGLAGAMVLASTRAVACALFLILAGAVDDRVRTCDIARLSGVSAEMPGWGTALAIGALGQAGVMGFGGAWGPMLALFGALPSYAPLAIVATLALVVAAAAHLFALTRVLFGKRDPSWERNKLLEAFGGHFPDLSSREWTTVAPLATLVVLLGIWPTPLVSTTNGTVHDLTNAVSPPGAEVVATQP